MKTIEELEHKYNNPYGVDIIQEHEVQFIIGPFLIKAHVKDVYPEGDGTDLYGIDYTVFQITKEGPWGGAVSYNALHIREYDGGIFETSKKEATIGNLLRYALLNEIKNLTVDIQNTVTFIDIDENY